MLKTVQVEVPDLVAEDERAKIEVYEDLYPEDPREWDNLGTMVCWHRHYKLGDGHNYATPDEFIDAFNPKSENWNGGEIAVMLPLYLFDHGGITMSTRTDKFRMMDSAGWDWGQVGYIFTTKDRMMDEFTGKSEEEAKALAEDRLIAEVNTYDQYLTCKVYYFTLTDRTTGETIDSCGGIFADGLVELKEELKGLISDEYSDIVNKLDFNY